MKLLFTNDDNEVWLELHRDRVTGVWSEVDGRELTTLGLDHQVIGVDKGADLPALVRLAVQEWERGE